VKARCWWWTRQGVEAQSVANCYTAIEQGLEVMPVLNKIDPQADPDRVKEEIEKSSALTPPTPSSAAPRPAWASTKCSSAWSPPFRADRQHRRSAASVDHRLLVRQLPGRCLLVRVRHGRVKKGDKILVKSTGKIHLVDSVGVFNPKHTATVDLKAGEVGFIIAGIKDIHGAGG
jgi:GTP-binding protein LepA